MLVVDMRHYSEAAVERSMKIQEVILRALAKRIFWWQAAEIIGISDRQMRRWKRRYERYGYDGLYDRRRGKPSPRQVPVETVERVLSLYREKYFDFNVRHFHEKLREEEGITLSYMWVKLALQGAGLVKKGRKRGVHRKRRPRRPLPGMLLHLDGSQHRWFQDDRWYDLIVVMDDATSEIYYAQLGARGVDAHGDGGVTGSDRAARVLLRSLQRPGQPFLSHSQGRRTCRSPTFNAGRTRSGGAAH